MLKLAVIGKDVSQSLSPKMHNFILGKMGESCSYDTVSLTAEQFASEAESLFERYDAFNVTIPYKTEIMPHLNELSGDAPAFGAVNTVVSETKTGYNTDGFGFLLMLENAGVEVKGKRVLVLGVGGAGRSCVKKLCEAGAEVFAYEYSKERLNAVYAEFGGFTPLEKVPVEKYDVILNCTGVGMHNTVGKTPSVRTEEVTVTEGVDGPTAVYKEVEVAVGEQLLSLCDTAVDLIYVPAQSEFLRIANSLGKRTVNGEAMLFYQAYMADCIYLKITPNAAQAKAFWEEYREKNV